VNIFEESTAPEMNDPLAFSDVFRNEHVDLNSRGRSSSSEELIFPSYFTCLRSGLRRIFKGLCGVRQTSRVVFSTCFPPFTAFVAIV
jgi:hypothetical protein